MWTKKDTNRVDVYEKTSLIITYQSPYTLHAERNCLFIYPIKNNLKFSRVHLNLGRNSSLFGHKIQDGSNKTTTKCQGNGEIGRYQLYTGVYCIVGCSRLDRYVLKYIFFCSTKGFSVPQINLILIFRGDSSLLPMEEEITETHRPPADWTMWIG